ncbi:hypothetical protein JCM8547_005952 [Rhodosporidiobolus lusitaniae]
MTSVDVASAPIAELLRQQAADYRNQQSALPLDVDEALSFGSSLRGKVVVVTGSGSGFGAGYAREAAKNGAKVVLSDRNKDAVEAVAKEIRAAGGEATAVACDVTSWDEQVKMFRHGVDTFGPIDVVVANAGIAEGGNRFMDLRPGEDGEPTEPRMNTTHVNVIGAAYTVKLAFFHLTRNPVKDGKAITILGSMASFFGLPGAPMYSTSKHAVLGMMRSLQYDAAVYNISMNIVNPWFVKTNIFGAVPLLLLAGIPLATVDEVVAAMIAATSKTDAHAAAFVVDFKGILQVPLAEHEKGTYYRNFMDRATGLIGFGKWVADCIAAVGVAIKRRSLA